MSFPCLVGTPQLPPLPTFGGDHDDRQLAQERQTEERQQDHDHLVKLGRLRAALLFVDDAGAV